MCTLTLSKLPVPQISCQFYVSINSSLISYLKSSLAIKYLRYSINITLYFESHFYHLLPYVAVGKLLKPLLNLKLSLSVTMDNT